MEYLRKKYEDKEKLIQRKKDEWLTTLLVEDSIYNLEHADYEDRINGVKTFLEAMIYIDKNPEIKQKDRVEVFEWMELHLLYSLTQKDALSFFRKELSNFINKKPNLLLKSDCSKLLSAIIVLEKYCTNVNYVQARRFVIESFAIQIVDNETLFKCSSWQERLLSKVIYLAFLLEPTSDFAIKAYKIIRPEYVIRLSKINSSEFAYLYITLLFTNGLFLSRKLSIQAERNYKVKFSTGIAGRPIKPKTAQNSANRSVTNIVTELFEKFSADYNK